MATQIEGVNLSFLQDMWQNIIGFMPKLISLIVLLIVGLIILKIVTLFLRKTLKVANVDRFGDKIKEIQIFQNTNFQVSGIIIKIVRWIIILLITISAAGILELQMVTDGITAIIAYLPKLFTAIAIFIIGVFLANVVKNAILSSFKALDIGGSQVIGNIVFFAITIIIGITALNHAMIDTEMITNNLTIIFGSFLLAFTIAFGLGSRDIVQRLLFGFYSRKNLAIGQKIKIGEVQGTIKSIDNIYLVLVNDDGRFIFPIKEVNDKIIQVVDEINE